ncbi:MAG: 4Fe-4S binding protein [Chloroflexota bacterium]|nr:4Fe-4S binding protein [Chloroflexota bacterium]
MKSFSKNKIWLRTVLQISFFVLIALIVVNHTLDGVIPLLSNTSLHALCPFGGVVSLYQLATEGTFVQKIHESSFILMIIVFVLAFLFGPVFCGWVCPLGSVQEWFGKLGKKLFKKKYNHFIPYRLDQYLRYLRYLMLAWVLYMTATTGQLFFADLDPYFALFNFWTGDVAIGGLLILGITLLASLLVERPWCKYACPYGAILGITNLFRVFSIRRVDSTCKSCNICTRDCPMNIKVHAADAVRDHQCIACLECTSEAICPIDDTVVFATRGDE